MLSPISQTYLYIQSYVFVLGHPHGHLLARLKQGVAEVP